MHKIRGHDTLKFFDTKRSKVKSLQNYAKRYSILFLYIFIYFYVAIGRPKELYTYATQFLRRQKCQKPENTDIQQKVDIADGEGLRDCCNFFTSRH